MTYHEDSSLTWVLLAVVIGGGERGATIDSIVSAADYINHAILKYEEFNAGMAFLLRNEMLARNGTTYRLNRAVTQRYKRITGHSITKYWQLTEAIILELKGENGGRSQAMEETIRKTDFEKAVREYLERNRVE